MCFKAFFESNPAIISELCSKSGRRRRAQSSALNSNSQQQVGDGQAPGNQCFGDARHQVGGRNLSGKCFLRILEDQTMANDLFSHFQDSSSVVLPFELPARTCNEQTIHLNFGCLNSTHRIRASLTYFVENLSGGCAEEKIDCKFLFPAIRFLRYATIGRLVFGLFVLDCKL
jgi:hypothetical protein